MLSVVWQGPANQLNITGRGGGICPSNNIVRHWGDILLRNHRLNFQANSYLSCIILYDNEYIIYSIPQNNFQLPDTTLGYCSGTGYHAIKLTLKIHALDS